jgi:hypothetical protein
MLCGPFQCFCRLASGEKTMDLNAEVDQLVRQSQTWIPMIMEYGSRVLLAVLTLAIGWWMINKVSSGWANWLA